MLNQQTLEKMNAMRLLGMAESFSEQLGRSQYAELSFEERVGLMVDREWTARDQRRLSRRLKAAKLRYPASVEDVDWKTPRGLDRQVLLGHSNCQWVTEHHNVVLSGPTGVGQSFLACALVEKACRSGFTGYYVRCPRLVYELGVARGDGSYGRWLQKLGRLDVLAIDDFLIAPLKDSERRDLMEIIEERSERRSTIVASQLPIKDWHQAIGDDAG
jgi:DNA replication protein DnaC